MQTGLSTSSRIHFIGRRFCAGILLVLGALLLPATASAVTVTLTVPAADDDGSFTVSWNVNPGSGYSGYTVLMQRFNGGSWTNPTFGSKPLGSQSHPITVTQSGTYEYRVDYGYCMPSQSGCPMTTGSSAIKTTIVSFDPPASAPTLTLAGTNNTGNYSVSWNSVSGATSYKWRKRINGGTWSGETTTTGTSISPIPIRTDQRHVRLSG